MDDFKRRRRSRRNIRVGRLKSTRKIKHAHKHTSTQNSFKLSEVKSWFQLDVGWAVLTMA